MSCIASTQASPRGRRQESPVTARSDWVPLCVESRERKNLQRAVDSRDVIGRAKGMLSARERITDDEAFTILTPDLATRRSVCRAVAAFRLISGSSRTRV